jgi:hypothetical protein
VWLRFRIRTLMLVVVGVALVSAVLVELPESVYSLILLRPAVGPLIGASWVACRYQPGGFDPISGGLVGGFVQAALIVLIVAFVSATHLVASPTTWWELIVELSPILLAVAGVYGLFSGLFVSWCLIASPLVARAFREGDKRKAKPEARAGISPPDG